MNAMKKVVDGFPNYQVDELGNVFSTAHGSPRLLKLKEDKDGYFRVNLCNKGNRKTVSVHRLVAKAFIENPKGLPIVNHLDSNRKNNEVTNLEWCTAKENWHHACKYGKGIPRYFDSTLGYWVETNR